MTLFFPSAVGRLQLPGDGGKLGWYLGRLRVSERAARDIGIGAATDFGRFQQRDDGGVILRRWDVLGMCRLEGAAIRRDDVVEEGLLDILAKILWQGVFLHFITFESVARHIVSHHVTSAFVPAAVSSPFYAVFRIGTRPCAPRTTGVWPLLS